MGDIEDIFEILMVVGVLSFLTYYVLCIILPTLFNEDFWPKEVIEIKPPKVKFPDPPNTSELEKQIPNLKEQISNFQNQIINLGKEYESSLNVLAQEIFDELSVKEKLPKASVLHIDKPTYIEDKSQKFHIEKSVIQRSQVGSKEGEAEVKDSVAHKSQIENPFKVCPYCGVKLNLPRAPMYCPYCQEKLEGV